MTQKGGHLSEKSKRQISIKLLGRRCCPETEFKKGAISWNKGKKGTHFSRATEFKKGHQSANYTGGLKTSKDGIYKLVKSGHYEYKKDGKKYCVGKYEQLARVIWRENYGDFPKEMVMFHKDGDIFNNALNNLEPITRKELVARSIKGITRSCAICGDKFNLLKKM